MVFLCLYEIANFIIRGPKFSIYKTYLFSSCTKINQQSKPWLPIDCVLSKVCWNCNQFVRVRTDLSSRRDDFIVFTVCRWWPVAHNRCSLSAASLSPDCQLRLRRWTAGRAVMLSTFTIYTRVLNQRGIRFGVLGNHSFADMIIWLSRFTAFSSFFPDCQIGVNFPYSAFLALLNS